MRTNEKEATRSGKNLRACLLSLLVVALVPQAGAGHRRSARRVRTLQIPGAWTRGSPGRNGPMTGIARLCLATAEDAAATLAI